jgi:hypothetical protein
MTLFTSKKEKNLWLWAVAVFAAIFSTLFMGKPLANQLRDQNVQAVFFVFGMFLVTAAVIAHGLKAKPGRFELSILFGIIAVYIMFVFRLGAPERSHLMEYSVLAIFIHKALVERAYQKKLILKPAIFALMISFLIGVIDELIQIVLPNRVFDHQDIIFNGIAVTMAIVSSSLLIWVRKRFDKSKNTKRK